MQTDETVAKQIVSALIDNLEGRSGLGDVWESIDAPIRREIKHTWTRLTVAALQAAPAPVLPPGVLIAPAVWESVLTLLSEALLLIGECGDLTGTYPPPAAKWAAWCNRLAALMDQVGVPPADALPD